MPKAARTRSSREPTSIKRGTDPAPLATVSAPASSLAIRALQVLIAWNRHSVEAQNEALEGRPSLEHVYALFWHCRGLDEPEAEGECDDPPSEVLWTVEEEELRGSVASAAALDAATARALHVAAGAPRDAAAALRANDCLRAGRAGDELFAVVRFSADMGEAGAHLQSVWRSRADAKQEARKLTGEEARDDGGFGVAWGEYDYCTIQAVKLTA
ncbi:hypothetical protein JKP88DRAFT_261766 [Tribonema minus]|uniref:Uncharacterized protein n=1 Tax=Tribonema minus TaxID=303371 RepID=A0A836CRC7_9STRA|nr:hypothetical protein JKP88DRAFT_261766 [Tribonema minus]